MSHIPVLLHKTIDSLALKVGDVYFDGTLGSGGHISEVCKRFGENVKLIGVDRDGTALTRTKNTLGDMGCTADIYKDNFCNIISVINKSGLEKVDKVVLDLGTSTDQIEFSGRGFSFLRQEPLLMTLDDDPEATSLTAYEIVNSWDENRLADIIFKYGDEVNSRRIAKAIIERRKKTKINTSLELGILIEEAIGRHGKIHPATKTFQALRIMVNDELGFLEEALGNVWKCLNNNGRLAIITFHSHEDRIVKKYFKFQEENGLGENIFKKPVSPEREEVIINPRSRSAKLRVIKKNELS